MLVDVGVEFLIFDGMSVFGHQSFVICHSSFVVQPVTKDQ